MDDIYTIDNSDIRELMKSQKKILNLLAFCKIDNPDFNEEML